VCFWEEAEVAVKGSGTSGLLKNRVLAGRQHRFGG